MDLREGGDPGLKGRKTINIDAEITDPMSDRTGTADLDELSWLFAQVYWIENEMEGSYEKAAFSAMKEEHKALLQKISNDSQKHRLLLERVMKDVQKLDINAYLEPLKRKKFDLKGLSAREVFTEILRRDRLAFDTYQKIRSSCAKELMETIWKGGDHDGFFRTIEDLIAAERKHIELVEEQISMIEKR